MVWYTAQGSFSSIWDVCCILRLEFWIFFVGQDNTVKWLPICLTTKAQLLAEEGISGEHTSPLGPSQHPVDGCRDQFPWGLKWPGCEFSHCRLVLRISKNACTYTSTCSRGMVLHSAQGQHFILRIWTFSSNTVFSFSTLATKRQARFHSHTKQLKMKSTIFWDITPCSPLKVSRRFGETSPP
jgi:hypothetical protein